jgi:hypothetical protein
MKKLRMFVTAALVLSVVGSALAFKADQRGGALLCQDASGTCSIDDLNFTAVNTGGTELFCNSAANPTQCVNQIQVVQDDK